MQWRDDAAVHDLLATGAAVDVRPADPERDAIDGRVPGVVVAPQTADAVAATLAWASERRLAVVIRGGGTKLGWGRPPSALDVMLDMRRVSRLVSHQHGDLTATVEAGASLDELNESLAAYGQWLPLDPPFAVQTTIGGLLATNDSGPLRHRYGTPRDLVIGIELATADGSLAKAGGRVVKNVAGYDLSKLVSGSFGALAAIVGATFKLSPLPEASSTVVVGRLDTESLAMVVRRLTDALVEPVAFELHGTRGMPGTPSTTCLVQFASVPEAVDAQVAEACAAVWSAGSREVVTGNAERVLWQRHATRVWEAPGAVVRASWLPGDPGQAFTALEKLAGSVQLELIGRAAVGAGLIRIDGTPERQAAAIEQLRASAVLGNIVLVRGSAELKAAVDVWPAMPNAGLLSSVKRALDPRGILGGGRGPL